MPLSILLSFFLPSLLLLAGMLGKKIAASHKKWEISDWYLGMEMGLAALTASISNFGDLDKQHRKGVEVQKLGHENSPAREAHASWAEDTYKEIMRTGFASGIIFLAFLYIVNVNQRWLPADNCRRKHWKLAGETNILGYGCVVFYMLWVKGMD